jgi:integrase
VSRPWLNALKALPGASVPRNVVLPDLIISGLVSAAYGICSEFGLLFEVAAVTGSRYSQLCALTVGDLQDDGATPRIMLPGSKKGRKKQIVRRPIPIPLSLARRLRAAAGDRSDEEFLLRKASGEPWKKSDHTIRVRRAVDRAGIDEAAISPFTLDDVTIYSLRHSSITRQLLRGTPVRVVAVLHDTSVSMIEKNYSARLADHSDAIARAALLDLGMVRELPTRAA